MRPAGHRLRLGRSARGGVARRNGRPDTAAKRPGAYRGNREACRRSRVARPARRERPPLDRVAIRDRSLHRSRGSRIRTRPRKGLCHMTPASSDRRMILCAGLQSGGTTLVSWTFLQRRDTNGVLDMQNSIIHASFDRVVEPIVWVKMTIGAFRWLEVCDVYRDLGWNPQPLLVVRDVRQ